MAAWWNPWHAHCADTSANMDRFHLVGDVINRVPQLGSRAAYAQQAIWEKLIEPKQYIDTHSQDMPEIRGWPWGQHGATAGRKGAMEPAHV